MDYTIVSNVANVTSGLLIETNGKNFVIKDIEKSCHKEIPFSKLVCEDGKFWSYLINTITNSLLPESDLGTPESLERLKSLEVFISEEANQMLYQIVDTNCTLY